MPIDLGSGFAALDRGLEALPRVIVAPLLLAGPTVLWLLYRFLVRPGTYGQPHEPPDLAVWVCSSCNSVTPVGQMACYRCRAERPPAIEPESGDNVPETARIGGRAAAHPDSGVGVPVGPGRPAPGRSARGRPAPGRPAPSPIALVGPPMGDGPVFTKPSRGRVSAGGGARGTSGTTRSASETSPGTPRKASATARGRSGPG